MAAEAFTVEQYSIIGRMIDERVGPAIGRTEGRTATFLREIRTEAAESLPGTTATSLGQIKGEIERVQAAAFARVDEAFKAAAAVEKERVDAIINSAAVGFKAEQTRLNELLQQSAVSTTEKIAGLEGKMASEDGANLTRVSEQLEAVAVGDKARAEVLNAMIQSEKVDSSKMLALNGQELTGLNEVGAVMRTVFEPRMNSFEAMSGGSGPQHFAMDGQGSRAPRLRVPDPGTWKMDILKNKDDGFHAWRENF